MCAKCEAWGLAHLKTMVKIMRPRHRQNDFAGTDRSTSDRLALEVAADERDIVSAIREMREKEGASLEALGFLLGAEPAQLSRHLKGACGTSLTNYLRIARALGFRCRIVLDRAEPVGSDAKILSNLKVSPHKVIDPRSASTKRWLGSNAHRAKTDHF